MKIYFTFFWQSNESISKIPFWKHLFKYCNFEPCNSEEEADLLVCSVFRIDYSDLLKSDKKKIMFTGEPIAIESEMFDINFSFHQGEYKNIILFPPFLFTLFNVEIPRTLQLKNLPKVSKVPSKFCCFMAKMNYPERVGFFQDLCKYKKVDSIGSLLNNTGIHAPWEHDEFISMISEYKFIIAFENSQIERYITEKILHAYHANIIPIYWGSQYIHQFFNEERMIYIDEYSPDHVKQAIEQIQELDNNDELYLKMANLPVFASEFDPDAYFETIQTELPNILSVE